METREGKDFVSYAQARNQAKWACKSAVRDYERNLAKNSKTNPKAFFSYVNSKLKTRPTIPDLKKSNGELTSNDHEKAEVLNNFFSSVFTRENTDAVPDFEARHCNIPCTALEITEKMVKNKIEKLKPHKAQGLDGINPRVIIEMKDWIAKPLADLMNKSLRDERLPQDWKDALVTPIFKKGSRSIPGNYRPVSLTSIVCKLTEGMIRDNIVKHLEGNKLITQCQHGFVSGKSCSTQLIECLDIWTEILDNHGQVDIIYLDYAKAFDKVPHERLIKKLEGYGIGGNILNWTHDFLRNRRQKVAVNGEESNWSNVLSGVPQGSVLGPVLFVVYINDLPETVHSTVKMFADDTKLFSDTSLEENYRELQDDIHTLTSWAKEWQLTFNAAKCKVMQLGKRNIDRKYYMMQDGEPVELETTKLEKDLGVHIDDELKISQHTEIQVNRANKLLGLLRRSLTYLDEVSVCILYKSLVRPILEYSHSAAYPKFQKDKKLLEGVQRRATKMISGLRDLSYEERLRALKLHSLQYRRDRGDMIECYKFAHGQYTSSLPYIPHTETVTRGHSLRFKKESCRTQLRQCFFRNRVTNLWNSLPDSVADAPSLDAFKCELDKHWKLYHFSTDQVKTNNLRRH